MRLPARPFGGRGVHRLSERRLSPRVATSLTRFGFNARGCKLQGAAASCEIVLPCLMQEASNVCAWPISSQHH